MENMKKEQRNPTKQSPSTHHKADPHELLARFTAVMIEIIEDATEADKNFRSVLEKVRERKKGQTFLHKSDHRIRS